MHTIDKQFDFCYGHRVWNQELKEGFATDDKLVCRHLHGHQGKIHIYLQAESLERGMVTDFKHLGWFKAWLDNALDHKFIMDVNDPLLKYEFPKLLWPTNDEVNPALIEAKYLPKTNNLEVSTHYEVKLSELSFEEECVREKYEGLILVTFVPTSENISKWLHEIVQRKMDEIGVKVSKVEFNETPKSRATYVG